MAGTGGAYDLTFTASNGVGTAATQNFTLTVSSATQAPTPAKLSIQNAPGNGVTGQALPTFSVSVLDANGNVITSNTDTISLEMTNPAASGRQSRVPVNGTVSVQAVNGVATFSDVVPDVSGQFVLTMLDTAAGLYKNVAVAVQPGTTLPPAPTNTVPVALYWTSAPATGTVGSPLGPLVIDEVNSSYQWITSSTDTLHIQSPAFAAESTTSVQAVNGVATFNNLIPAQAGSFQIIVADTAGNRCLDRSFDYRRLFQPSSGDHQREQRDVHRRDRGELHGDGHGIPCVHIQRVGDVAHGTRVQRLHRRAERDAGSRDGRDLYADFHRH